MITLEKKSKKALVAFAAISLFLIAFYYASYLGETTAEWLISGPLKLDPKAMLNLTVNALLFWPLAISFATLALVIRWTEKKRK